MRLRRRIATLLLASLSLSTSAIALTNATPGAAQPLVPGVVDVAVSIEAKPSVVSPPGEYALYEVQASNQGILGVSSSTVSIALPAGSSYDDSLSSAACSGTGSGVTCPVGDLPTAGSSVFAVVASTPLTTGLKTATATIAPGPGIVESVEYQENNTDTAQVDVRATSGNGAFGLVRGGDSISLDVGDGRKYTMDVPASSPGVIVSITPNEGTAKVCGTTACGQGFHTDFVQHPYFKAVDPQDPIVTSKTFGPKHPCHGRSLSSGCYEIFYAKSAADPLLVEMDPCTVAGVAEPSTCLNGKVEKENGSAGKTAWFNVLMLSNDPVELPPLLLGT